MTDLSPEMQRQQLTGFKVVIEMSELQCLEVEIFLKDPIPNRDNLAHAGGMLLDMAHIALAFGMDGTVARKLEDMATVLQYILSPEEMTLEYRKAREQLAYVLAPYQTLLKERTI